MLDLYIQPFILAVLMACILTAFLHVLYKKKKAFDRKDASKISVASFYYRLGGVAVAITFLFMLFFDRNLEITIDLWGLVFGSVAIVVFGMWDDLLKLSWKFQMIFQISLAIVMFSLFDVWIDIRTIDILHIIPFDTSVVTVLGGMITILWFLALINSLNWLDGLDGLSGGVIVVAGIFLFLLSMKPEVNQPPVGIISLIMAGAYLGFLIFNVYPAKIISGTVGTYLGGFILAYLSIYAGAKVATALLILSLPLLDSIWVMGKRMKDGVSIFHADRSRHLHYRLKERGWSTYQITLFFYSITGILGCIALYTKELGKGLALVLVGMFLVGIFIWAHKEKKIEKEVEIP